MLKHAYLKLWLLLCALCLNQLATSPLTAVPSTYNWIKALPAQSPPSLANSAMAFDPVSNQLILFGGNANFQYFNMTWAWNGNNWNQLFPATTPQGRAGASFAYDSTTNQLILFGGFSGTAYLNDTWTWNGSNWVQLFPANSPSPRAGSMAFDAASNQLLLFGGQGPGYLNDTWVWNGTNWMEQFPANPLPPPRYGAVMGFDAISNQLILFGGGNNVAFLGDTWTWDGSNWMQLFPPTSPPPRLYAAMAFDAASGQLLVTGGFNSNATLNDLWSWNVDTWVQLSTQTSQPARYGPALAFDQASNQLVFFGGANPLAFNDTWLFLPLPQVISVQPPQGPESGGTSVTIIGSNFTGASDVKFGSQNAVSFTVDSSTQITAISPPASAGIVDVAVTTAIGTSLPSTDSQFTYVSPPVPPPVVTSVFPSSGPESGGTMVTIGGQNFISVSAVKFGALQAMGFTVDSPTQITAISPAGTGIVDVTVTTASGTSPLSPNDQFTYLVPPVGAPVVLSVNPSQGPETGGTNVIIQGQNFVSVSSVKFGSQDASGFIVNNSMQISATSPPGTGTVNVLVTTPSGTSLPSRADHFTYSTPPVPAPIVTSISRTSGPSIGGTKVIITGQNFITVSAVQFGMTDAAKYEVNSSTQITAISPAGTGIVDITVTTPGGTSAVSANDQFTYISVPINSPDVTSISPSSGSAFGGTVVSIKGQNFNSVSAVHFGTRKAATFTVNSSEHITAISPPGSAIVDITVTTPIGTSLTSPDDQFTYLIIPLDFPAVTKVSPSSGQNNGGTVVTILGFNFNSVLAVKFGTNDATAFTVDSPTQITAISPPGAGVVNITVTTIIATSITSSADQFTYLAVPPNFPTITNVLPSSGQESGGTVVTIQGQNFNSVLTVRFGSQEAANFWVNSPTQITAISPAGTGIVNITVTTPVGTSLTSTADQFNYLAVPPNFPNITSISPSFGPERGGTAVTITGLNFTLVSEVRFGTKEALNFKVNSPTRITAISPPGIGIVDVTVTTAAGTSLTSNADHFTYLAHPLPPINLHGKQRVNRFASQANFENIVTWEVNPEGTRPVKYKIYRDRHLKKLAAVIASNERLKFKDPDRKEGRSYTYFIVAIDQFGDASQPASVTVHRHK